MQEEEASSTVHVRLTICMVEVLYKILDLFKGFEKVFFLLFSYISSLWHVGLQ